MISSAVKNLFDFWLADWEADAISSAIVVYDRDLCRRIAADISKGLDSLHVQHRLIDFHQNPRQAHFVAQQYSDDESVVVCLAYVLDYRRMHADKKYRSNIQVLESFDSWNLMNLKVLADVTDSNFEAFLSVSRSELRCLSDSISQRLMAGESFTVDHNQEQIRVQPGLSGWYLNDGGPNDYLLPCGEVSTAPLSVDGKLNFSGTILGTIPFGFKYGRVKPGELELNFSLGQIMSVAGSNNALVADLEGILSLVPALAKVGEASISFNPAISALNGLGYQWEEKYRGFHFGLGAELVENIESTALRQCDHHVDFVMDDCAITVGDDTLFADGVFT